MSLNNKIIDWSSYFPTQLLPEDKENEKITALDSFH
jgi:hypothetical protein